MGNDRFIITVLSIMAVIAIFEMWTNRKDK